MCIRDSIYAGVNAYYVAQWDGAAWTIPGGGTDTPHSVQALAVDNTGNLYAGGDFGSTVGLARWDGATWAPLSTGGSVHALAVDGTGATVYVGGNFVSVGEVGTHCIAKWHSTAWALVGSGNGIDSSNVNALALDGAGNLYAGGDFLSLIHI